MKSLVSISVFASSWIASAGELYTITPVSQNQVVLNQLVKTNKGYEVVASYPALVTGPWNAQKTQVTLTSNEMVAEQLRKINPHRPTGFVPPKESALLQAAQDYSFDVKLVNPCMVDMSREDCIYDDHIYTVMYNHKFTFK